MPTRRPSSRAAATGVPPHPPGRRLPDARYARASGSSRCARVSAAKRGEARADEIERGGAWARHRAGPAARPRVRAAGRLVASFFQPADAVPDRLIYLLYVALVIPGSVAIVGLPFALPLGVAGAVLLRAVAGQRQPGVLALAIGSAVIVLGALATWPG